MLLVTVFAIDHNKLEVTIKNENEGLISLEAAAARQQNIYALE
jgi:hypothetical protein